jgi:hypothetical protein
VTSFVNTGGWTLVGQTVNCRFFATEPLFLVALPFSGAKDDAASARQNSTFQERYFHDSGTRGVVIVLFDAFVSQDHDARQTYRTTPSPSVAAVAIVAESLLGRAMAAFSVGSRVAPSAPRKMFGTMAEATAWGHEQLRGGVVLDVGRVGSEAQVR